MFLENGGTYCLSVTSGHGVEGDSVSVGLPLSSRLEGDGIDVAALYSQHYSRLVGLAAAVTLDRDLAEEIVQDSFVGLQRNVARVDRPLGYLQRSVVNAGIGRLRRRRVAAHRVTPPALPTSTPEIDETWSVVVALPVKQRAVVVLRFWEDMTIDSIAETLGWPPGSVKSTLHRALKRLREELS